MLLDAGPPSALQARVLAALAGRGCCSASSTRRCRWRRGRSPWRSRSVRSQSRPMAWRHPGSSRPSAGSWRLGWRRCRTSFTLAYRTGSIEDVVRAAANHMYLLITVGRFTEALDIGRRGREAARSLDAPPGLTWILDNNTAAVLIWMGRWAEADQLLAELIGESQPNVTRYLQLLQLLQLELAVGRGERERAEELATALRKSPDDPRLYGPLHACLAEQALNVGDLATAAEEVLDGLAALEGAALAEEEIRLLAAGARASADLAWLPSAARPGNMAVGWQPAAASLAGRVRAIMDEHGGGQPVVAAFGALAAAENARCGTAATAGRRGGPSRMPGGCWPALPGGICALA